MQSPAATGEFEDLKSHKQMWNAFTRFTVRSVVAIIILLLFIGFVTGVL